MPILDGIDEEPEQYYDHNQPDYLSSFWVGWLSAISNLRVVSTLFRVTLWIVSLTKRNDPRNHTKLLKKHERSFLFRHFHFRFKHHRRRPRYATIFSDAPKVDRHKDRRQQRNADAMPAVSAQQGIRIDNRSTKQAETHVVVRRQTELRPKWPFITKQRRRARHVCSHGHRPESELIIGQQISGKRKQKRQHQQHDAHAPV